MIHEVHDPFFLHVTPIWRPSFAQSPGRPRLSGPCLFWVFRLYLPAEHTWSLRVGYVAGRNKGFLNRQFLHPCIAAHIYAGSQRSILPTSLLYFSHVPPYVPQMSAALSVKPATEFLLAHECGVNLFCFCLWSLSAQWGLGFDGVMSESDSLNAHSGAVFCLVERSSALLTFISSAWDVSEEEDESLGF